MRVVPLLHDFQSLAGSIFAVRQVRRNIHVPVWEGLIHGLNPSLNASLAGVDFLPPADQTNYRRPIFVAVHIRNQKFRFRMRKVRVIFLPTHEAFGLPVIPCALSFVKNDNTINRRSFVNQRLVAKVMNILDEGFDAVGHFSFSDFLALSFAAAHFIARQRFTQNRHQRPVAGQKDCMRWLVTFTTARGNVQTNQCLSSTGNTRYKTNDFAARYPRIVHQFFDSPGSNAQITCTSIVAGNRFDRMLGVKRARRFNDGRRWMIRRLCPLLCIYR